MAEKLIQMNHCVSLCFVYFGKVAGRLESFGENRKFEKKLIVIGGFCLMFHKGMPL